MYDFLICTTERHDSALLLLTALVCLAASAAAIRLYAFSLGVRGPLRAMWLGIAGLSGGSGVWATHFVGLIAYEGHAGFGYDSVLTLGSWALGVVGFAAVFVLAGAAQSWRTRAAAGLLFGPVIAALHYVGVAAMATPGGLRFEPDSVIVAVALASVLGAAALAATGAGRRTSDQARGALLLAGAVAALHFVGMAGVSLDPGGRSWLVGPIIPSSVLAALVAMVAAFVVFSAGTAAAIAAQVRRQAHHRLQTVVDVMPAGVALFDRQDRLVLWNARYAEQGGPARWVLQRGRSYRNLLQAGLSLGQYPDAIGREAAWIRERLAQRRAERDVEQYDGGRWLRLQDRFTPDGGLVSVSTDLTDLKRDAEALAEARDRAEAANRAKDAFLANMSHELRTPLNGVIAVAEVLGRSPLDARQRELVEIIEASSRTLTAVLGDVLDMARIEAGGLELSPERMSPAALVAEVAGLWRAGAEAKGLLLTAEVAPDAAADIEADPVRLRQVLGNLVSNAVKFTHAGEVAIRAEREGDDLILTVRDTGVGFAPELAEAMFDRFRQADGSIVRRFGGSGLGLSISRDLLERMGGTIAAQARPGEGATFQVRLPAPALSAAAVPEPAVEAAPAVEQASRVLRVLLAEDHPANRKVVEIILAAVEAELTSVENGRLAVDAFAAEAFDVVLMDMQMPVMDGLTAVREIRALEQARGLAPTPCIMLTANALPEHVEAALEAGADRHLSKPVSAAALLSAMEALTRPPPDVAAAA